MLVFLQENDSSMSRIVLQEMTVPSLVSQGKGMSVAIVLSREMN